MNDKPFTEHFVKPNTPVGIDDWSEIAPNAKINFILFNPRSGSTFLASILDAMNDLGKSNEYFNQYTIPRIYGKENLCFQEYLKEIIEEYSKNNIISIQAEWFRFSDCINNKLLDPHFFGNKETIKLSVLLRRNVVLQAISFIQALATNIWHKYGESLKHDPEYEASYNINDEKIFEFVRLFLNNELEIFNFCSKQNITPNIFFYEDLISEPFTVISKLYSANGIDFDINKFKKCIYNSVLTRKIKREKTPLIYLNFVKKYPFIEELLNLRMQNFSKQIEDKLMPNIINTIDLYKNNPVKESFY